MASQRKEQKQMKWMKDANGGWETHTHTTQTLATEPILNWPVSFHGMIKVI